MAIAMQRRLREMGAAWRDRGVERPFGVRMGINTGYCNVGNFGSAERMDYTIIGAEANLAARLQYIAEPGSIVISFETYSLVKDAFSAHALAPISVKGIMREVVPYLVDRPVETSEADTIVAEHSAGLDLRLHWPASTMRRSIRASAILRNAVAALAKRQAARTAGSTAIEFPSHGGMRCKEPATRRQPPRWCRVC